MITKSTFSDGDVLGVGVCSELPASRLRTIGTIIYMCINIYLFIYRIYVYRVLQGLYRGVRLRVPPRGHSLYPFWFKEPYPNSTLNPAI